MFDKESSMSALIESVTSPAALAAQDQELIKAHQQLRSDIDRLEVASNVVLSEIMRRGSHEDQGFPSPTAYIIATCRMRPGRARRHVSNARAIDQMPTVRKVAIEGSISSDQVEVLAAAHNAEPDLFESHETALVDVARELPTFTDFERAIDYWKQAASQPPTTLPEQQAASYLHISKTFDGMYAVDGLIDPDRGGRLLDALITNTPPPTESDARPTSQRRIDTLLELVEREPEGTAASSPRVMVHVDYDTFNTVTELAARATRRTPRSTRPDMNDDWKTRLTETTDGRLVDPTVLDRIACDAIVCRVVFGSTGELLNFGRSTRLVPPALRQALIARDRTCRIPGCGRPARWGDAHHIVAWQDGGLTDADNCVMVCRWHHTRIHTGQITVSGTADQPNFYNYGRPMLE